MTTVKTAQLVLTDTERTIHQRAANAPKSSPNNAPILLLAFDGVNRDLLYDMLDKGELPKLTDLLSGEGKKFPHAYLDPTLLATMPSSTMAAWTTAMTGVPPAVHGVAGNEFFIREENRLGAPAPVSFSDSKPTIEIYTDGYLNKLVKAPTVYERMREREPHIAIWVALHQIYSGADRLLFATNTVMARALEEGLVKITKKTAKTATLQDDSKPDRSLFAMLDEDVIDKVVDALGDEDDPVPDVLTVYLTGTDLYAHVAEEGPDEARRAYLHEVVDPALGKLSAKLRERNALSDRWVVLTSDHGHTPVRHDEKHALYTEGPDSPARLIGGAGYRLRPFKEKVDKDTGFDAVLAEGGATSFIYVADRTTCSGPQRVCDWKKPPRYREDVLPLADAIFRNNKDGKLVKALQGTLDLVLTREPKPYAEDDLPFEVYVGDGRTVPLGAYLEQHPHPTYVETEARLRDLAVGRRGERAGDIMLLAHNGDRDIPDERYYFASPYRSWHGSPSRQDSEIPLIVANPRYLSEEISDRVRRVLGSAPRQQKVTDLLLDLRGEPRKKTTPHPH
ncbi:MAG: Type phosphodiesterase / nucleotide pyrophosphatase [Polyangiaceae bacterium]|nr:Type phosphodiesterase / nucleotide pyrophosphatase [Polyangiaceae bacterium]